MKEQIKKHFSNKITEETRKEFRLASKDNKVINFFMPDYSELGGTKTAFMKECCYNGINDKFYFTYVLSPVYSKGSWLNMKGDFEMKQKYMNSEKGINNTFTIEL